jgi:hypothetical protein
MKKLLTAVMLIISMVGFTQDSLKTVSVEFKKDLTVNFFIDSTQTLTNTKSNRYILTGNTFYVSKEGYEDYFFSIIGADITRIGAEQYKIVSISGDTLKMTVRRITDNKSIGTIFITLK